jgi:hypothetical protein
MIGLMGWGDGGRPHLFLLPNHLPEIEDFEVPPPVAEGTTASRRGGNTLFSVACLISSPLEAFNVARATAMAGRVSHPMWKHLTFFCLLLSATALPTTSKGTPVFGGLGLPFGAGERANARGFTRPEAMASKVPFDTFGFGEPRNAR